MPKEYYAITIPISAMTAGISPAATYKLNGFDYEIFKIRAQFVDVANIEHVLVTIKRKDAEGKILEQVQLSAIATDETKPDALMDLNFPKENTIKIKNNDVLTFELNSPINLSAKDINFTLFGLKG